MEYMEYDDFELEIGLGTHPRYPLNLLRSPAGIARATMAFPYDEEQLQDCLASLQDAILSPGDILWEENPVLKDFAQSLFDALFSGDVYTKYLLSRERAMNNSKGLRLKLRIRPPELAALPWELILDRRPDRFLSVSPDTPFVRYLEVTEPSQPLTISLPLRILGMIASPEGQSQLDIEQEKERIERAILPLRETGAVDLTWLEGQTWRDLQKATRKGPWHIFHFIGHGDFEPEMAEGYLLLSDEQNQPYPLRARQLADILAGYHIPRLVVLNACEGARGSTRNMFSSTASILLRRGIPAVIAMQYAIADEAAIAFSRYFYEAIAEGVPVDAAITEARKAIFITTRSVEWMIPALYMNTPDGILFKCTAK